ncbi:phosphoribosylformylglycinamidine cyclo-ligase [Candidatus Bathyarchaeota archaeon]|nr:phosphoribosylformylglycinamidine cyclo-ligase [Candidatus Bathyarchaeota archaeon]
MKKGIKKSKYAETGVDVEKRGIEVFKEIVDNLFPTAFCVVTPDPNYVEDALITHTDSAGSKPIQCYLHWKETSDITWFKGLAQDVLAMNLDDIICVGACPINFVDYIAINPFNLPKQDVLHTLKLGFQQCSDILKEYGINILYSGGETADLPDQLRTLDVSGTINGRAKIHDIITGENIKPGDAIIGLRSGGKTKYETKENSGIMCNFISLARHCLMKADYEKKYPEIRDPKGKEYYGKFDFDEYVDELGMTVGEAIISPTRFFAPVIVKILEKYRPYIKGITHNTGGGQTRCLKLGKNIHYIKDSLPDPDPIFYLIQRGSGETWRDMYKGGNMGVGMDVIVEREVAEDVLSVPESYGLKAQIIGRCEKSHGKNKLTIYSPFGKFQYP